MTGAEHASGRKVLHIVEPTLSNEAGHCMSLVRAMTGAAQQAGCSDTTVWAGRSMALQPWTAPAKLQAHFERGWRRLQALALYRKLLQAPGRVLVATAGSADLISLDWAARSLGQRIASKKVSVFVHWLKIKSGKAKLFEAIARRHPGLQVLAPTEGVVQFFKQCGFHAQLVAYPLDASCSTQPERTEAARFKHLLVPGAARMDKGFGHIVELVEAMQQRHLDWPIVVQTSLEHKHDKDPDLMAALQRLRASRYKGLQMRDEALNRSSYRALFDGAIVIQPYRAADFLDRVSGVTLDALNAGAPVVVTDGTWMSRLVQRHQAGVAAADLSPDGLIHAIEIVLADHVGFAARAQVAAAQVQSEHSARALMDAVLSDN
jgi:hypothetical protein